LLELEGVIVAVVTENLPADFHLELADQDLVEGLKCLECDSFESLSLIEVLTLPYEHVFQCRDVVPLKLFLEDFCLERDYLIVIQEAVIVAI
jgi:hypothetical protein